VPVAISRFLEFRKTRKFGSGLQPQPRFQPWRWRIALRLSGRIQPQIVWAKLRALRDGRRDREQEVFEVNLKWLCGMN
jgi:hypothetical protein